MILMLSVSMGGRNIAIDSSKSGPLGETGWNPPPTDYDNSGSAGKQVAIAGIRVMLCW